MTTVTDRVYDINRNPVTPDNMPMAKPDGSTGIYDSEGFALAYHDLPPEFTPEDDGYDPTPEEAHEATQLLAGAPSRPWSREVLAELIAGLLSTLGLEPERNGSREAVEFQFLGRATRVEVRDIQAYDEYQDEMSRIYLEDNARWVG